MAIWVIDIEIILSIISTWIYATYEFIPILFATLGLLVASTSYRQIYKNIQTCKDRSNDMAVSANNETVQQLKKWKSQHIMICDYVAHWNQIFNMHFCIGFSVIVLELIVYIFYLLIRDGSFTNYVTMYTPSLLIKDVSQLFILCSAAEKVKNEVNELVLLIFK